MDPKLDSVGIVGAGLMGGGIASLVCAAGVQAKVFDVDRGQLTSLPSRVSAALGELQQFGLTSNSGDVAPESRLVVVGDYSDLADCDVIIEAVVEDVSVKKSVYAELEAHLDSGTLIATNTSNIVPSVLAGAFRNPSRFLVAHFWNPPYAVPLVEVVPHSGTGDNYVEQAANMVRRIGNEPVVLNEEIAGFVGNRLQYALLREALWIVQQGIASPAEVDRVMTLSLGRRYGSVGPFATADLGGLDTFLMISEQLMPQLASDLGPLELMRDVVAQGNAGAKTGRGFLEWPAEVRDAVVGQRDHELFRRRREERDAQRLETSG